MFRGVQTGRVDDKNRLKLPALVRNRLLETYESGDVFLTSLTGRDMRIYPLAEWEAVERSLSERKAGGDPAIGKRNKKILFRANHYGAEESLDNQGRLLVPGALREGSGMSGEVFLQWTGHYVLALSAERYHEQFEAAALDDDEMAYAATVT